MPLRLETTRGKLARVEIRGFIVSVCLRINKQYNESWHNEQRMPDVVAMFKSGDAELICLKDVSM